MKKIYTIPTELGSIVTQLQKEAIKLALRNRVNEILITYENGVKYTHTMKNVGSINIRQLHLSNDLENFENNFLSLVSSSNR